MRRVYIAGIGMTRIDRYYEKGYMQLIHDAAIKAFNDAKSYEPEAIVVGNMLSSSLYNQDSLAALALDAIGFRGLGGLKVEAACGSGGHAVVVGYSLVASGLYDQ
ncbi:MAG: acetyl-CoA acetyltransferase, partial [Ignisphaera sp.]